MKDISRNEIYLCSTYFHGWYDNDEEKPAKNKDKSIYNIFDLKNNE